MMEQKYLPLWNKIQAFSLDNTGVAITLSSKLAASQNWSVSFTARAIAEYKKFLLLCCISERGAAPSHIVDEVWHLHLTYTQSYWMDLCRDTLGKDIHHYPSAGGDAEDQKHREWYRETLQSYRSVFGTEPPSDIWPAPKQEGLSLEAAVVQPGSKQNGLLLTEAVFTPNIRTVAGIAVLISLPFIFIALVYGTPVPFSLAGSDFLRFFPLYGLTLLLAFVLYRYSVKKWVQRVTASYFPEDVSAFQVANFLYGKHRAVQAGIVDLIKRDLLELTPDNSFLVKNSNYLPSPEEPNPIMPAFMAESDGSVHTYESISLNWYDRERFSNPSLVGLDQWASQQEPVLQLYFFHILFYGVAILRMVQGLLNGRPITYLVIETALLSIAYFKVLKSFSRKAFVYGETSRLYRERLSNLGSPDAQLLPQFALQGFPAINGLAEGVVLGSLFGAYQRDLSQNKWGSWNGADSGGSDSGGSSCSGGDSGGGSSCGGGSGCGGCGGGGGD